MKVLHLTLKKKWFDLIASGEKKEEYREIKPYWINRLAIGDEIVRFDEIHFRNGYSKDAPVMKVKNNGIHIRTGNYKWGAEPGKKYFVIQLGEIINPGINRC